jgi:hypothetical protein
MRWSEAVVSGSAMRSGARSEDRRSFGRSKATESQSREDGIAGYTILRVIASTKTRPDGVQDTKLPAVAGNHDS